MKQYKYLYTQQYIKENGKSFRYRDMQYEQSQYDVF